MMEEVLSPAQIEEMRKSLLLRRDLIIRERGENMTEMRKEKESLKDLADIASYEDEVEKMRWLVEKGRRLETKIGRALQRISDGRYGQCAECDSAIPYKRLSIDPTSEYCINCMSEFEGRKMEAM